MTNQGVMWVVWDDEEAGPNLVGLYDNAETAKAVAEVVGGVAFLKTTNYPIPSDFPEGKSLYLVCFKDNGSATVDHMHISSWYEAGRCGRFDPQYTTTNPPYDYAYVWAEDTEHAVEAARTLLAEKATSPNEALST